MQGKKILVTGGAGSIGSELVRQLSVDNEVYILDINETGMFELAEELRTWGKIGDVRDPDTFQDILDEFGAPDIIFHAAALKHVTPNELDPIEAVKTNVFGTWNVIKFAKRTGAKLINISTDKAVENDCVMGLTKKIGERFIKNNGYVSVRFGNVMGSRGSLYPIWERQASLGKPITVTDVRMTRYFMTVPNACELVIKAAEIGEPGDVLILDMGEPVKIIDLAEKFSKEKGVGIQITGVRPGEKLEEKLMTPDEEARAVKIDKFFVIHA